MRTISNRFRFYSWIVAISDALIGSVFLTAHPAMTTPSWYYVFLFIPWWVWCGLFIVVGVGMGLAIGSGSSKRVRKIACITVVAKMVWAVEFAMILPAVLTGNSISWLGVILVATIAALEMLYLGMPASKWLDSIEEGNSEYRTIGT